MIIGKVCKSVVQPHVPTPRLQMGKSYEVLTGGSAGCNLAI